MAYFKDLKRKILWKESHRVLQVILTFQNGYYVSVAIEIAKLRAIELPWSERFFLIFLLVAKWRTRVAKRRERKSLVTLDLNLTLHADASCQTCEIDNKGTTGNLAITCLAAANVSTRVVKSGTREKRSAHACLLCFRREFAIEIIRDTKTN